MGEKHPDPQLIRFNFLIGEWHTKGEAKAIATSPAMKISGTDSYVWILGGCFILHRADVMMGEEKTEVLELIGEYDASTDTFQMRSFDNQGNYSIMEANFENDKVLKINGDKMRATLSVVD